MTGIKILRSFVKFISINLPSHVFETDEQVLQIMRFNGELYKYDLAINPQKGHRSLALIIDSFSDDSFVIMDSNKIVIHDLSEFLETDDTSLVLTYGRCILDNDIISKLNMIYYDLNITIDNFKFLIEMEDINE